MATAPCETTPNLRIEHSHNRRFFTWISVAMIALSLAAFMPSIAHPSGRPAPVSGLAAAHGIVFLAWLFLFLIQSRVVASRHIKLHRRLGLSSIFFLALMIPLGYTTTIAMVRRGFDLSGDLRVGHDPSYEAVFPLFNVLIFALLVIAALLFRHRPQIHKRLMLFANIELMPAPLAHLIGHTPSLASLPPAIVMIPISILVIAAIARDWLTARRIHPLTWCLASLRILSGPLEAGPIGSSAAWHHFVYWLAR